MADKKPSFTYDLTIPVPIAHPKVITAEKFKRNGVEEGEAYFSADFVFDPTNDDLIAIKKLATAALRSQFPKAQYPDISKFAFPFKDGNTLADDRKAKREAAGKDADGEYQRGKIILKTKSKFAPVLSGVENGKVVDYETEDAKAKAEAKFYFGAECLASLNFVPHDKVGGNPAGVTCYLNGVFTTNKGTKLKSGGVSGAQRWKGYVGSVSTTDPTAGLDTDLDDEIPF